MLSLPPPPRLFRSLLYLLLSVHVPFLEKREKEKEKEDVLGFFEGWSDDAASAA